MFRAVIAALIASLVSARLYTEYEPAQKFMWEQFKQEHGREVIKFHEYSHQILSN